MEISLLKEPDIITGTIENKKKEIQKFNSKQMRTKAYMGKENIEYTDLIWYDSIYEENYEFFRPGKYWSLITTKLENFLLNTKFSNNIIFIRRDNNIFLSNDQIFLQACKEELEKLLHLLIMQFFKEYEFWINNYYIGNKENMSKNLDTIIQKYMQNKEEFFQKDCAINLIKNTLKNKVPHPKERYSKNYYTEKLAEKIKNLQENGVNSPKCICENLRITRNVYYYVKNKIKLEEGALRNNYENNDNFTIKSKLKGVELEFIKSLLDDSSKSITAPEIKNAFYNKFKINIPLSTLRYTIKHILKYSFKKTKFRDRLYFSKVQAIIEFKIFD